MADHLLEVRNLSVDFYTATGTVKAVRNISYHVDRGETLAILGESGSGKSVSSSAIMNLIDMPPGKISSGEILLNGKDLLKMSADDRRAVNGRLIAMIFQDPLSHLNPVYTVGWQMREALRTHGIDNRQAQVEALRLFKRVALPEPEKAVDKYPHEFSGGQRQRVMIAMALALKPNLLIADEPTTALDVTVQAEVLALLKELQRETGMGVLIITHDLGVVSEVADRVVVMEKGVLVESGTVREVYRNPQHPYTKKLIAAAPGKGQLHEPSTDGEPILKVRNARKSYGGFEALKGISFDLKAGETVAVVGESGSGKSTLARILLRLDDPDSGTAHWKGQDLFTLSPSELFKLRRDLQMVFQDPTQSLNPRMTVYQLISEAWVIHPEILPKAKWRARAAELLERVGLSPEHMGRYPHQFSGGQRQRIAIARALALEPQLIVCDEAVSALDVSVQAQVVRLLDKLRREMGIAFIFIAHDLPLVRDFADYVMVMQKGEVVEFGTVAQVFDNPQQRYTQALISATLDPDPDVQAANRNARLASIS
ncbi:ABC transporter ATP-binding protein [Agrobacterium fabrum]|uniref:ABC transporter, nucleotide binding/ATPase protein (Oligopeptide) n=2 Tax=Agrobacterium fabrum TaxID=1176649 RepID=A9CLQ7_AGRFC|nr:ABC transporter ATP-binding protein [Agrobacterium fabrum]KEY52847.1 ABC transporter ATP-binding protein [Agrobacterium tumefaciens]AAK90443.1 ABC transporter, nucleotide binding/ATPase protein (oligopeptide) [Agrobacterium fabrum str. C58]AYM60720.1 peptide/nickel transport system ATP-binding protein [Agrobacterium fabrum]AYM65785.1 peptide/nickel transport system ATP-binding protein [Agrobacterium fabrum]KJX90461.1 Glutathione import ATP-binding protein gsiA [Agrobacterium tumefaciens]